jgi:dTDP-4-dehydrorhamnose 3,5-epimerase
MKFECIAEPMDGLFQLKRTTIGDNRGAFSRLFCAQSLKPFGWQTPVAQSNFSITKKSGSIRGLHFQHPPHAEKKLVTCVAGAVFDVAVDLRKHSKSFGKWFGCELSPDNATSLLIPEGFAHGFQALTNDAMMVYFHSSDYNAKGEAGVKWNDKDLAISWPLPPTEISQRDQDLPDLSALQRGIEL